MRAPAAKRRSAAAVPSARCSASRHGRDDGHGDQRGQDPILGQGSSSDVVHRRIVTGHRAENVTVCVGSPVPLRRGPPIDRRTEDQTAGDPAARSARDRRRPVRRSWSIRARRSRSSRSSRPRAVRSPVTSWRRCSGPRPTMRRPAGPCVGRCRRSGRPSATRVAHRTDARRARSLAASRSISSTSNDSRPRIGGPTSRLLRPSPAARSWRASPCATAPRSTTGRRPARYGSSARSEALLDRLGSARAADGDAAGAIEAARRRVELDPLDEPGQRRLIELLAAGDDRAGAIRQYRSLVALFDRELGVAPLRETTDAVRGDPRGARRVRTAATSGPLAVRATPAASGTTGHGLPFVGRDRRAGRHPRRRCDRHAGRTAHPGRRGGGDRQDPPGRGRRRRRADARRRRARGAWLSGRGSDRLWADRRPPTARAGDARRSRTTDRARSDRSWRDRPAGRPAGRVARIRPNRRPTSETTPGCGCSKRSPTR